MTKKQTITGDDGTRYEIQIDGTLKPIGPHRAPTSADKTPPIPIETLDAIPAVGAVPVHLVNMFSDLSVHHRPGLKFIDRGGPELEDPIPAYRPPWIAFEPEPKLAPRLVRPRVRYRGVSLDPLIIWPGEDRRPYFDTSYPYRCVCRITNAVGTSSGVIVGPRHVLTASHCIDWNSGGVARVEVNPSPGIVFANAVATSTYSFTQITGDPGLTDLDEDYAVIVTDQRIGDRYGFMGVRTYNNSWDGEDYWRSIGYAPDIGGGLFPCFQKDQNLDEDEWDTGAGRAMTTSADVVHNQSGSPMFAFWSDGPYVVAVVSSAGTVWASGNENWCSGGNLLTRLVKEARAGDP